MRTIIKNISITRNLNYAILVFISIQFLPLLLFYKNKKITFYYMMKQYYSSELLLIILT